MEQKYSNKKISKKYVFDIIIILLVIILAVILCLYIYIKSQNSDILVSENMKKNKSYDGLNIVDIKAKRINGTGQLIFTVENNTDKDYKQKSAYIVFFDTNGNIIKKINIVIPYIKKNDIGYVDIIPPQKDLFKADDFKISD